MIDLHNHTISSDGELTPEELVDFAIEKKLSAIAITDHDSLGSIKKAIDYSKGKNIEIISGVELSCDDPLFNYDKIDVIGLFVDSNNNRLVELIRHINVKREGNKKRIISKLKSLGYDIEYSDVKKTVKGTFGRPHIARYLIKKYPEKFKSVGEVFDKLIGRGKEAFLETNHRVSIKDVIDIIKGAGGISILAHPGIYPKENSIKIIDYFIENGGQGIETYYPYHIISPKLNLDKEGNTKLIEFYRGIVKSKNILESGGNERSTLGEIEISDGILEKIRNKANGGSSDVGPGWTLWFTGLHGSGKSTISERLSKILKDRDVSFVLLDGDELRKNLSSDLGYTLGERNEHMKRVAELCKSSSNGGKLVIASVASPTYQSREYARKILEKFFLVYVKCSLDVCENRDVKGHYKKARDNHKGFENFISVSSKYEEPKSPDIVLDTDKYSVEESVQKLVDKLEGKGIIK